MPPLGPHHLTSISISPLLKSLVGSNHTEEKDVVAAKILVRQGDLSDAQIALFLGLLKVRGHGLKGPEIALFDQLINLVPSPQKTIVSIAPLLRKLLERVEVHSENIAHAIGLMLEDRLPTTHGALLLGLLAFTGLDKDPVVLVQSAGKMLAAAKRPDRADLLKAIHKSSNYRGQYCGGLCDIVGTGGDGHSTYNVSTTASIIASSHLLLSKHGNRASSSTSGSADLLEAIRPNGPKIEAIKSDNLPAIYQHSNYAFLFAPNFHPGMKHVAALRKDLGIRTIFNVLGPLVNPVEDCIEARIVGVAEKRLGPVFAEALRLSGAKKAMVVCGAENLDEISCAGKTFCWRLFDHNNAVRIDEFELEPADFGLPSHPLSEVAGGKLPRENASILANLLENKLQRDDPVLHFVLINTAALFAIAGICEDANDSQCAIANGAIEETVRERGPGGQRWKEGVRLARDAIERRLAIDSFRHFIDATHTAI